MQLSTRPLLIGVAFVEDPTYSTCHRGVAFVGADNLLALAEKQLFDVHLEVVVPPRHERPGGRRVQPAGSTLWTLDHVVGVERRKDQRVPPACHVQGNLVASLCDQVVHPVSQPRDPPQTLTTVGRCVATGADWPGLGQLESSLDLSVDLRSQASQKIETLVWRETRLRLYTGRSGTIFEHAVPLLLEWLDLPAESLAVRFVGLGRLVVFGRSDGNVELLAQPEDAVFATSVFAYGVLHDLAVGWREDGGPDSVTRIDGPNAAL
eukprot:3657834-Prymnesium_polylepis.2